MRTKKNTNGIISGPGRKILALSLSSLFVFLIAIFTSCKKNDHNPPGNNATPNLQLVTDGLISPLTVVEAPDDSKRLFIVDQTGKIWIIGSDGAKMATPFIDIAGKMVSLQAAYDERGLLGLAFH